MTDERKLEVVDKANKIGRRVLLMIGAAALAVLLAVSTGCAGYNRQTYMEMSKGQITGYSETVSASGLFNQASLKNAASTTAMTNGQYRATKGLEAAKTSGNAELLNAIGQLLQNATQGAAQGAAP